MRRIIELKVGEESKLKMRLSKDYLEYPKRYLRFFPEYGKIFKSKKGSNSIQ
jgi:hypothetical protein